MKPVLEEEPVAPGHDVREEVAVEGRVLGEQVVQASELRVVVSRSRRIIRGGICAQSRAESYPWSGYGRESPTALKITPPR